MLRGDDSRCPPVVQAVAKWAKRRLIMLAVRLGRAAMNANYRLACRETDYRLSAQQPYQPALIVSRQSPVGGRWPLRHGVQAE